MVIETVEVTFIDGGWVVQRDDHQGHVLASAETYATEAEAISAYRQGKVRWEQ